MSDQEQAQSPVEPNHEIPALMAEEPNQGATLIRGVTKMIAPSIMQCSQGGYIAVIPGIGLMAASSMEEIMRFVEQNALHHFGHRTGAFPRVVEDAARSMAESIKKVDPIVAATMVVGLIAGSLFMFGKEPTSDTRQITTITRQYPSEPETTNGSLFPGDHRGSAAALKAREALLPEVYVRGVRTTPYDGGAERPVQDGKVR